MELLFAEIGDRRRIQEYSFEHVKLLSSLKTSKWICQVNFCFRGERNSGKSSAVEIERQGSKCYHSQVNVWNWRTSF
jgi:hypothetical protein